MLDIKYIRENKKEIEKTIRNKGVNLDLEKLLEIDKKRLELQQQLEILQAEKNRLNKKIKESSGKEMIISEGKKIKEKITKLEPKYKEINRQFEELMVKMPNIISSDTPIGKDESKNKILRKFKEPTKFDFKPKNHMELGILNDSIDTEKAAKISGSRFNYLFNQAVFLQFAIIQFVFKTLTDKKIIGELAGKVGNPFNKPFTPVIPPVIAKAEIMKKMDRFDPIEERYYLEQDDALLVGSAEHTLGPLHMDEIIDEKDLPIRYIGYSTAFRREAGGYGKDTTGILRRHQFDKAEMETFIQPEYGLVEQDLIVAIQEYIVQQLGIPYQVIILCTGDMGKPDFRQIDINCWMPGQNEYRETHTSDYMTDYQARRLNTKLRRKNGSTEFIHMNDATACAIGRMIIAIMENYQQKDGTIKIPTVLEGYIK